MCPTWGLNWATWGAAWKIRGFKKNFLQTSESRLQLSSEFQTSEVLKFLRSLRTSVFSRLDENYIEEKEGGKATVH